MSSQHRVTSWVLGCRFNRQEACRLSSEITNAVQSSVLPVCQPVKFWHTSNSWALACRWLRSTKNWKWTLTHPHSMKELHITSCVDHERKNKLDATFQGIRGRLQAENVTWRVAPCWQSVVRWHQLSGLWMCSSWDIGQIGLSDFTSNNNLVTMLTIMFSYQTDPIKHIQW